MDGIHDMGGTEGWGTVKIDPDEPVFAEQWEGRAFALSLASMGVSGTNLDAFRHALERQHPLDYLSDGYYGRWINTAELLCVDSGIIAPGAVEARGSTAVGLAQGLGDWDEALVVGVHPDGTYTLEYVDEGLVEENVPASRVMSYGGGDAILIYFSQTHILCHEGMSADVDDDTSSHCYCPHQRRRHSDRQYHGVQSTLHRQA